jgi:[ribosomal protein S5]-alanine N-acetyltransferase
MPVQSPPPLSLNTRRLWITRPSVADEADFLRAVAASQALHRPWVRPPDTTERFRRFVDQSLPPAFHAFVLRRRDDNALAGCINLSNVVLGMFSSGYLGYFAFAGNPQQGLMTEGLKAVVRHAFGPLKLHRLEANIQPGNTASIALVRRCGFRLEGYSPRYLKIDGRWRDHERWARVKD